MGSEEISETCIKRSSCFGVSEKKIVQCRIIEQRKNKDELITVVEVNIYPETETCDAWMLGGPRETHLSENIVYSLGNTSHITIAGNDKKYSSSSPDLLFHHNDIVSFHHNASAYDPKDPTDIFRIRVFYGITEKTLPKEALVYYTDLIAECPLINEQMNSLTSSIRVREIFLGNLRTVREPVISSGETKEDKKHATQYANTLKELVKMKMARQILEEEHLVQSDRQPKSLRHLK